jgi:hypothetical protein
VTHIGPWRRPPKHEDGAFLRDEFGAGRTAFGGSSRSETMDETAQNPMRLLTPEQRERLLANGRQPNVDLEVRGDCSDDELELIRRLAQEADTRRIVVRRVATLTNTGQEDEP